MAAYNKVILVGNLTRDPQMSYLPSQTAVVDFGLAVNRKWTSKEGEKKEDTCFIDCRAFGKQAETINKYLKKGNPVFIDGRLSFDQWTAQDGTKRSRHRITVEGFQFLGGGAGVSNAGGAGAGAGSTETEPAEGPAGDDIPF